jgi:hypothetical protein
MEGEEGNIIYTERSRKRGVKKRGRRILLPMHLFVLAKTVFWGEKY